MSVVENEWTHNMNNGVSIIVPARNEELYIRACIEALESECSKGQYDSEVIVVDNCSTDKTLELARMFAVKTYSCSGSTPSEVRNVGAKEAQYDILAFVDADCVVTEGWLSRIFQAFDDESIGAYGGEYLAPRGGNWVEKDWNPVVIKQFKNEKGKLPGGNFSIRASLFSRLNGFDETLMSAEDDDLSRRVLESGMACVLEGAHSILHLGYPKSLTDTYKKQVWHGSTQLRAHGWLKSRMVIVTWAWMALFLIFLLSVLLDFDVVAKMSLLAIVLAPLAVTINRLKLSEEVEGLGWFRAYVIAWYFLAGRSVGLVKELKNYFVSERVRGIQNR